MKKYIKPAVVEVKLDNEAILAASYPLGKSNVGIDGNDVGANDIDLDWDEE